MAALDRAAKFRHFIEAWTKGNLDAADEMMAPQVVYHMPPFPDCSGTGALKQVIADFRRAFPDDFQVTLEESLEAGDTTVHRWSVSGTYKGESPLLPGRPTGRRTTATGCHICHWVGDKVGDKCAEAWHFGDWLGWLQKAGVVPPLG